MWFAETEETTITNAIQLLSNTHGRDNHLINQASYKRRECSLGSNYNDQCPPLPPIQVGILIRELCRLHNCPLPPDLDNLTLQFPRPGFREHLEHSPRANHGHNGLEAESEDGDDLEENISDDQEGSDVEEDLPLEMDEGKNSNKVRVICLQFIVDDNRENNTLCLVRGYGPPPTTEG